MPTRLPCPALLRADKKCWLRHDRADSQAPLRMSDYGLGDTLDRLRLHKTEAIVLKHMNIGEGDKIVTFYTPQLGKLRAVARGIRKVKSRLAGHLEPLTRCQVLVHRGHDLETVSQCETIESNLPLRQDLWRMTCGLYMAELVERFTQEGQENEPVYDLFHGCLSELAVTHNVELLLRYFELRLLGELGYDPEIQQCVECRIALAPTANFFSPSAGGALCAGCRTRVAIYRPLSLNALKVLRLLAVSDFSKASNLHLSDELAVELDGTMRQYIRYLLEQELKSTDFLDLMRRDSLAASWGAAARADG